MKVIQANWEKVNLGKETFEIEFFPDDNPDDISPLNLPGELNYIKLKSYDHSVMKLISSFGYTFCESQLSFTKSLRRFDTNSHEFPMVDLFEIEKVRSEDELNLLISEVNLGIFSTDRIALDPEFGQAIANSRYSNWIRSMFADESAEISFIKTKKENKKVGFFINVRHGTLCNIVLGGIFKDFLDRGIGHVFVYHSLVHAKLTGSKTVKVKVSSNNPAMVNIYTGVFGFQLVSSEIVVKAVLNK